MQWRLSGQVQAFVMMLLVDGQFVVPDTDSVSVTLRGNSGEILSGIVASAVTGTQVAVITTADQNQLPEGELFQTRYLRLDYKVKGVPAFTQEAYRIHQFIPHTVDGSTVRDLVGAEFQELPDSAIDVTAAYFSLVSEFGDMVSSALTSAGVAALAANEAIALRAAIELCPSMQVRLLKSEKADTSAFERNKLDFEKLERDLRTKLNEKISAIRTGNVGFADSAFPTFFAITTQTDRITGTDN